jgi:hypothetical protein
MRPPVAGKPVIDYELRIAASGEEVADRRRNLFGMRFQREMAGIEEANDRTGNVAFERLRSGRQEERIVLAPYREKRRPVGAKVVLKDRIERDVALVVAEQIQLNVVGAGTRQIEIVERLAIRGNRRVIDDTVGVLPPRGLGREEGAKRFAIGL